MKTISTARLFAIALAGAALGACAQPAATGGAGGPSPARAAQDVPALKDVFAPHFMIGTALDTAQFTRRDTGAVRLAIQHFNTVTPENVMKWEVIHPEPGRYDFSLADRFMEFAEANDMFVVGHTLVWHSQTPAWVFEDGSGNPATREQLLARMREHIQTVMGRYRGRVQAWDVVNEALNEDGTLRQSPWLQIIGEDYLEHAFRFAHEVDPQAELYYNDYSLEGRADKRAGALRLVRRLQHAGAPIHGIGLQGHLGLERPTAAQLDTAITEFAELGIHVMITELDIDVLPPAGQYRGADISYRVELQESLNPYRTGLPDEVQQQLARRYADLFDVFLRHRDVISRVTFWGVHDGQSWRNYWPVEGRTAYPLLFDRDFQPKPAFHTVVETARQATAGR
jgi:endo-1,4-beta-xylanase